LKNVSPLAKYSRLATSGSREQDIPKVTISEIATIRQRFRAARICHLLRVHNLGERRRQKNKTPSPSATGFQRKDSARSHRALLSTATLSDVDVGASLHRDRRARPQSGRLNLVLELARSSVRCRLQDR